MSGLTTICPLDESGLWPGEVLCEAGEPHDVEPDPPDPTDGDRDEEWEPPTPVRLGRRVQLAFCEPITHQTITEAVTANIDSCSFQFGPGEMTATMLGCDPALELFASKRTGRRGKSVVIPDLKGLELSVGVDGRRFWSGVLGEPTPIEGGMFRLHAVSGEAVFSERTLGETEQPDFYEGRGAFPTTTLTGWTFSANVAHRWNTTDQYEGQRSLQVSAVGDHAGVVYGPWVNLMGHESQTRYPVASAILRIDSDLVMQVLCEVQTIDGTPVSEQFTLDERGITDDGESDWQGPVAGRGRLQTEPVEHNVRAVIVVPAGVGWCDIDLVRIQWPTLTGYPDRQDLSRYPARIARDYQDTNYGGSPEGIISTIRSLCGITDHLTWAHQDDHPGDEAMASVTESEGGPDIQVTPNWRLLIDARRGSDRTGLALSEDNIIACRLNYDPGGEFEEYRAITDLGSGSYRHVFGFSTPRRPNRRRSRTLTHTPTRLSYDPARKWAEGQAKWNAQEPTGATVTVSFDEGRLFSVGDGVPIAWAEGDTDGAPGLWGPVRIGSQEFRFADDICVMTVGPDPVVAL